MDLKVMNYNILHGFHQIVHPFALEAHRLRAAQDAITAENPNILVLTEACYGNPNKLGHRLQYEKLFNYPFYFYGPWGEHEWGNCILSKYPITAECVKLPDTDRTAIKSKITIGTKYIHLDVIHPQPEQSGTEKIASITSLLEQKKVPYIITGDFNSLSDEDDFDRERLIAGFKLFAGSNYVKTVDSMLAARDIVIPGIKSYGLRDAFEKKENRVYTIPTDMCNLNKDSAMRIDHCFISPDIQSIDAYVVKNKFTEIASDHYPICMILRI